MEKVTKLVFLIVLITSCQSTKNPTSGHDFLFKVGETPVTSEEFLYVYNKNNFKKDSIFDRKDVEEYLGLFINFKLKVKEALALDMDKEASFKTELEGYRKQLAKPYLTESKVTEQLVQEAYDRMKYEIDASHILLRLNQSAEPEDTLKAYDSILKIRDRILQGESFASVAEEVSEDRSTGKNGGRLGYFSALRMVYPFENAAYTTEVGNVSEPFRTRFGYHILLVNDKRPSRGKVKPSHIMIRSNEGMPEDIRRENEKKINRIYERLMAGEAWHSLCSQFSQDLSSAKKGGQLPWIGTGNVDPSFEDAAFSLQNPGDISKPVLSPYGWHIIRLEEKKGIEPFEELAGSLKEKIERDSRANLNKKILISRLKKENEYVAYEDNVDKVIALADSSLLSGKWEIAEGHPLAPETLFTIEGNVIQVDSFFHFLGEKQRPRSSTSPGTLMRDYLRQFEEQTLVAFEEAHLADKYEDYRMLLKEYYEGILLFELMDRKVWSKAMKDSTGLTGFFDKHREMYVWKERAEAIVVDAAAKDILEEISALKINSKFAVNTISLSDDNSGGSHTYEEVDGLVNHLMAGMGEEILIQFAPGNDKGVASIKEYMMGKGVMNDQITLQETDQHEQITAKLLSSQAKNLEKRFNTNDALAVQIKEGTFEKGENEILNKVNWGIGDFPIFESDGRYYRVIIRDILPAAPKELDEIKGVVISDYQNYLEKEWINELKVKYPVKINNIAFEKVIEKLQKS
ncbi:MAG: peptidylprolyl isomerase [Cytophagales bacterium]|nr:peptidylprolyl isomerase [Cytophagales bacterium]